MCFFKFTKIYHTRFPLPGDIVDFKLEDKNNEVTGGIYSIHDRLNYAVRKSVNLKLL